MTGPRIGSLFSGYGGLDMGVQAVLGGSVAWHVEFAEAPSKILAHHWPDVPNYHDVTTVDWASVEPVDVLTGGFPCQDVSLAGARAGLMDGTRSGLWSEYAKAIDVLRPSLVLIENVRGLLSAKTMEEVDETDSDLEWEQGGVGVSAGVDRPVLNAFGRVLGDLAELGYDSRWLGIRAADAGAPHGRFRVFVVAYPSGHEPERWGGRGDVGGASAGDQGSSGERERVRDSSGDRRTAAADTAGARRREGQDCGTGSGDARARARSLELERSDGERASTSADPRSQRGHEGHNLAGQRREGADGAGVVDERGSRSGADQWGKYRPAIARWEAVTESSAPNPTKPDGKDGSHRLSAEFVEWMMGLPAGHVTDPAIGLNRNEQLKALGNGVVWQQAALALSILLSSLPHNLSTTEPETKDSK